MFSTGLNQNLKRHLEPPKIASKVLAAETLEIFQLKLGNMMTHQDRGLQTHSLPGVAPSPQGLKEIKQVLEGST